MLQDKGRKDKYDYEHVARDVAVAEVQQDTMKEVEGQSWQVSNWEFEEEYRKRNTLHQNVV